MLWNPRYVAYSAAHGLGPVEMLHSDELMWPGGKMCGFIVWIGEQWRMWDRLVGNPVDHVRTEWEHGAFTRWLEGGAVGASCRTCETPIVWAETESGRKMPLDATPTKDGTFVLVNGKTWKAKPEDVALHRPLYTSHFATCPDRDQHRKPR